MTEARRAPNKLQLEMIQAAHLDYIKGKPGGTVADMRNLELKGLKAPNLRLARALMSGIDATGADFRQSHFSGADLFGAVMRGANLYGCNFFQADLRGAKLTRAVLGTADFREADMRPGDIRDNEMNRMQATDIQDAILDNANFARAKMTGTAPLGRTIRRNSHDSHHLPQSAVQ